MQAGKGVSPIHAREAGTEGLPLFSQDRESRAKPTLDELAATAKKLYETVSALVTAPGTAKKESEADNGTITIKEAYERAGAL